MKKIISAVFVILGLALIFYPILGKFFNKIGQSIAIEKYRQEIEKDNENNDRQNIFEKISRYAKNNKDCVIGYIECEKINLKLPIYEGTNEKDLLKGVGHVEKSGLPIKNEKYNCVLVGHTGVYANTLFDNLEKLNIQDTFYITILENKFKYEIFDVQVVEPENAEILSQNIEDEKTVVLITCIPKYVNSHRLMIRGREK